MARKPAGVSVCVSCVYASWTQTKSGALSSSGDGRCTHPSFLLPPVLPASAYFTGGGRGLPNGGFINSKRLLFVSCPTHVPSSSDDL